MWLQLLRFLLVATSLGSSKPGVLSIQIILPKWVTNRAIPPICWKEMPMTSSTQTPAKADTGLSKAPARSPSFSEMDKMTIDALNRGLQDILDEQKQNKG